MRVTSWRPKNEGASSPPTAERVPSEKPRIACVVLSGSSQRYDRGTPCARRGFSGGTLRDGPARGLRLVWTRLLGHHPTTLAQAKPEPPAQAPSRPRSVGWRLPDQETLPGDAAGPSARCPARFGRAGVRRTRFVRFALYAQTCGGPFSGPPCNARRRRRRGAGSSRAEDTLRHPPNFRRPPHLPRWRREAQGRAEKDAPHV